VGTSPYILKDENAGSSAANRFALTRDYVVNPDGVVALQYDATSLRWRVVGPEGIPAGVMLDFGGASAPAGYLLCDGSVITRASQPALFVAIGTTWNTGGEAGTDFRLPNFQRRAAVGSGGAGTATLGNAVGNVGGSETVTLALSETPAHSHGGTTGGQSADHTHSGTTGTVSADHTHSFTTSSDGAHTHDVTVQLSAGGVTGVQGTETGSGAANIANAAVSAGTHQHTGTTGGISANHTHAFTSGGVSVGHTHTIESEGGGGAHNNLGPRAIVTKIIKT
jgi:microcystin-dependent protein